MAGTQLETFLEVEPCFPFLWLCVGGLTSYFVAGLSCNVLVPSDIETGSPCPTQVQHTRQGNTWETDPEMDF